MQTTWVSSLTLLPSRGIITLWASSLTLLLPSYGLITLSASSLTLLLPSRGIITLWISSLTLLLPSCGIITLWISSLTLLLPSRGIITLLISSVSFCFPVILLTYNTIQPEAPPFITPTYINGCVFVCFPQSMLPAYSLSFSHSRNCCIFSTIFGIIIAPWYERTHSEKYACFKY